MSQIEAMAGWPLVGRSGELERVRTLLADGARGLVLAGPAGVGKTRLAVDCLALASEHGLATLRISATQAAASLPLGAFAPFLPDLARDADRAETLRETARAVVALGEGRRLAILVDDAHLLDDLSAALTHQLATTDNTFVVVTVRSGDPVSDAITALWKDGVAERIQVMPLGPADVEQLLAVVLGGHTDHATIRLLYQRTEGNVLFLRELVEAAVSAGVLRAEQGLWRLSGSLPASERLVELVQARLEGLGDAERVCLRALAIAEPLGVELLTRVAAGADLEWLEQRGLARIEEDRRRIDVRLGHPIYGEVMRARLSPLQNRRLSGALADALDSIGARRRDDVLRLAVWRLATGGSHDPGLLLAAGRQAFVRHDLKLAERLGRAAWEHGGGFESGVFLGTVLSNAGAVDEADRLFSALVPAASDDGQHRTLAVSHIDNYMMMRRSDLAMAVAEKAEAAVTDLAAKAAIAAQRARLLNFLGRRDETAALAEAMLPHAEGGTLALIAMMLTDYRANRGELTAALDVNTMSLAADMSRDPPPRWMPSLTRYIRTNTLAALGELDAAEAFAMDAYARAVDESNRLAQGHLSLGVARTMIARGRVTSGATWARLSDRLFREEGRTAERAYALIYLGLALALSGAAGAAEDALREYESLPGSEDPEMVPEVVQVRAWTAVALGDLTNGRRLLADAVKGARSRDNRVLESVVLHDLVRLGRAADAASRLCALADVVEGRLASARAAHAVASVAGDAPGLDAAARSFEDIGTLLLSAEAAMEAAVAWRRAGEPRKATAAERRAHVLAGRCEGAATPALATSTDVRATLTDRELEIVRLAASGVSNRDIAARLFLSLHTVENKLHSSYEKLGIKGRRDLSSVLDRL